MSLTVAGIFSGAGAGVLGAQQAGFKPVFVFEPRDFFNVDTHEKNFKLVPIIHEAKDIKKQKSPTLVIGGPDCKQFSNLRTKIKQNWNNTKPSDIGIGQFFIHMKKLDPDMFIVENLSNLLKIFKFEDYRVTYLKGKGNVSISHSYKIQILILDTFDFGVHQHRKRLFILGSKDFKPNFDEDFSMYNGAKVQSVEEAFKTIGDAKNQENAGHNEERIEGFSKLKFCESYYGGPNNRRLDPGKPSPVVTSHCTQHVHPYESRTLNPRENAVLMGWPNDFVFSGNRTSQLDQVGKSMAPPIAKVLSKYMKKQHGK